MDGIPDITDVEQHRRKKLNSQHEEEVEDV